MSSFLRALNISQLCFMSKCVSPDTEWQKRSYELMWILYIHILCCLWAQKLSSDWFFLKLSRSLWVKFTDFCPLPTANQVLGVVFYMYILAALPFVIIIYGKYCSHGNNIYRLFPFQTEMKCSFIVSFWQAVVAENRVIKIKDV